MNASATCCRKSAIGTSRLRNGLVELPMTRQDIADYLGLTMETVSRAMRKLKSDGIIDIEGNNRVRLVQPELVAEMGSVTGQ